MNEICLPILTEVLMSCVFWEHVASSATGGKWIVFGPLSCCNFNRSRCYACALSSRLTFLHLPIPAQPIGTLIPICNSCRNADCISHWVIKLGASTLTRLRNQWHFPMETTTRLQSICSPNLIKQLTRSSVPCFISCTLGDMKNMSSAA